MSRTPFIASERTKLPADPCDGFVSAGTVKRDQHVSCNQRVQHWLDPHTDAPYGRGAAFYNTLHAL